MAKMTASTDLSLSLSLSLSPQGLIQELWKGGVHMGECHIAVRLRQGEGGRDVPPPAQAQILISIGIKCLERQ